MKTISNPRTSTLLLRLACLLLALLPTISLAQGGRPQVGFIRLVNAVGPGIGNTKLLIDGQNMYPKGYKLGQRTGGIGLEAGAKKIAISKEGVEEGATSLNVEAGETISLIAFAEKIPADKDKPERWGIKILRLKQRAQEKGFRLTVLSVCRDPELLFETEIQGREKPEAASVKRLMTTTIDLGKSGGDVVVRLRNSPKVLTSFRPDDPGNYVLVVYDGEDGEVHSLYFYDPKFVIAG
jgi:hypothetical protein